MTAGFRTPGDLATMEGDDIVIRLSPQHLVAALACGPYTERIEDFGGTIPVISDQDAFARAVCCALNLEREDGSSKLSDTIDAAMGHAIDDGCDGVELDD